MILQEKNNIENALTNRLSVQVSLNGLSFLVTDPRQKPPIAFIEKSLDHSTTPEELLMDIESTMFKNDVLNHAFSEVTLVFSTPLFSVVPLSLFDETKASEYLKFNSKILANDYMAHDKIEAQDLAVVYVPYMNINNFFFEKYGSFSYYHSITILLKAILEDQPYALPRMYLHFQKKSFDCVILKNGKLQLCNTYSYKTPEDFIYYTLFCIEQLGLSPETLPVKLCGEIEKEDETFKMAFTYIRNLEFLETNKANGLDFKGYRPHNHFILKNTL